MRTGRHCCRCFSSTSSEPGTKKKNLLGFPLGLLEAEFSAIGISKARAKEAFLCLYKHGERDILKFSALSTAVKFKLNEHFHVDWGCSHNVSVSEDGTIKRLTGFGCTDSCPHRAPRIAAPDNNSLSKCKPVEVETVYIPKPTTNLFRDHEWFAARFVNETTKLSPCNTPTNSPALHDFIANARKTSSLTPSESLLASFEGTGSACLSSQAGCSLTCSFCRTGAQDKSGLRNLSAAEIVGQLMLLKEGVGDYDAGIFHGNRAITNVVMMGMGEPLLNYRAVKAALLIMGDGNGLGYGRKRVTVSTSGIVPAIERLSVEAPVKLAVSLHAVTNELRDVLVPINKTYPLQQLLPVVERYSETVHERVMIEYVMLKGINDGVHDARELVRLLRNVRCTVNLIPFNPWKGSSYECSSVATIQGFSEILCNGALPCSIRWPRGRDIGAACGQLTSESKELRTKGAFGNCQ